jgi:hypothetical protein
MAEKRIGELKGTARYSIFGGKHVKNMGKRATTRWKFGPTPKKKWRVIVCGEPYSGNRMMMRALESLGCAATILHGINDLPRYTDFGSSLWRRNKERLSWYSPTHAVIPVRAISHREKSALILDPHGAVRDMPRDLSIFDVCNLVIDYHLPCKMVSYEGFVEDPRACLIWLAEWMGIDAKVAETVDTSWVFDANQKYRDNGAAPDA